ncbi:MAG: Arginyl-tRNA synthetase, partial [Firmicutes bacterium]|nr:Arginyl-tRNA synthetase [Bacillota bacterium]
MDIKDLLNNAIHNAAQQAIADGAFSAEALPQIILEVPPQKEFGDYATNFA